MNVQVGLETLEKGGRMRTTTVTIEDTDGTYVFNAEYDDRQADLAGPVGDPNAVHFIDDLLPQEQLDPYSALDGLAIQAFGLFVRHRNATRRT